MVIDIIILVLVLAGTVYGFRFGLVGAMTHLAAIPFGLAVVIRFSPLAGGWLQLWLPAFLAGIFGWVLTTMLVGLLVALFLRLANTILCRAGLQTANRLIGGWAGLVGMVTVLALLHLTIGLMAPVRWNNLTDRHVSLRCLRAVAQEIEGRLPEGSLPAPE